MEEILCSERISPFLHSCCEENILLFSVHNLALDVSLFLTRGLLLEKIGECIKTNPCDLQRNYHGHEIVLNQIKDNMLGLCLILIEFYFPLFGGSILYHLGYITIKVMLFKNVQYSFLPCDEVASTFEVVFRLNKNQCHGCNILLKYSLYT